MAPHKPADFEGIPRGLTPNSLDGYLVRLTIDPWFVESVVLPQFQRATSRADTDLESAKQQLTSTAGKLQRLQDGYVDGRIEADYYNRKLKALRATRGRHQAEVERLEVRVSQDGGADTEERLKAYWKKGVGKFKPDWPHEFRVGFIRQHFCEVIVSERGVELLTVRVPQGPDGIPEDLRIIPPETTWKDLLGYDPFDKTQRLAAQGMYTSSKIAERLGLKNFLAVNYLLRVGVLEQPSTVIGGVRYWNEKEALAAEAAYKAHTTEPPIYKWGLPKKERYNRKDIAKILDITVHQVRYWCGIGKLLQASGRDSRGAYYWKEEEVEQMVAMTSVASTPKKEDETN